MRHECHRTVMGLDGGMGLIATVCLSACVCVFQNHHSALKTKAIIMC